MIILGEEAVPVVVDEVPGVDVATIPGAEAEAVVVEITTNTDHWTIMELRMMHRMTGGVATVEVRREMVTPWTIDLRFVLSSSNATNPNQPLHGSLDNIVVFQVFAYIGKSAHGASFIYVHLQPRTTFLHSAVCVSSLPTLLIGYQFTIYNLLTCFPVTLDGDPS